MTITANQCVADGGLINPEAFPARAADLDTSKITGAASDLRSMGNTVKTEVDQIKGTWDGLGDHYQAPEQQQVYDVLDPAVTSAEELKGAFRSMASHLDTYAAALAGIKPRLQDFEERAAAFRADVVNGVQVDASEAADAGFGAQVKGMFDWVPGVDEEQVTVPWYEDGDTTDKNTALLEEYAGLLEEISTAVATCANDINRLVENMCIAPVEALPAEAFTNPQQPMPWGSAREEERNCTESTGHGVSNFVGGLLEGGGMLLLGYNPATGDFFTGEGYGQSWGGLGDLVGSTLLMASPVGWVAAGMSATGNDDNAFSDFMYERAETVVGGWGSLVGYDYQAAKAGGDGWHKWDEDGVATGVESVLNVGTFFIPGAGAVGGGIKGGATGAKISRIAAGAADFAIPGGSWLLRGGARVTPALRTFFSLGDNLPGGPSLAGHAPGMTPTALLNAVDDIPVQATPQTPVSQQIFGGGPDAPALPDGPGAGALPGGSGVPDLPGGNGVPDLPGGNAVPDGPGGSAVPEGPGGSAVPDGPGGNAVPDGPGGNAAPDDAPVNPVDESGTLQGEVGSANQAPANPYHAAPEALPEPHRGNVGTVDPDLLSPSELTMSGRLIDPDVIPPQLAPYVEQGVVINDGGVLRLAEQVELDFTRRNADHSPAEFARQAELQRLSLEQQSVLDWQTRYDGYHGPGGGRVYSAEQTAYRNEQIALRAADLEASGLSPADARAQARAEATGQDALHGPDQGAGGNPENFTGLGDRGVNRSMGWHWGPGGNALDLGTQMRLYIQESGVPRELLGDIRLNVEFNVDLGTGAGRAPSSTTAGFTTGSALPDAVPGGGAPHVHPDAAVPDGATPAVADQAAPAAGPEVSQPDDATPPSADGPDASPANAAPEGAAADATSHADLASTVPGGSERALHAGSADPQVLDAVFRSEYPDLLEVNAPRHTHGIAGFDNNCTRCVIAADHTLGGGPASAMPTTGPAGLNVIMDALGGQFRQVSGYDEIVRAMQDAGEGARGVVALSRGPGQVGHVFTVVHDRNGVVFLDAQTGRFARLEQFQALHLLINPSTTKGP